MRFEPIQIRGNSLYNFYIETWDKPDNSLKERIRDQIREAMEALGREPDSYSVTVLKGDKSGEESGNPELPHLLPQNSYIIFAFRESGGNLYSLGELEEEREEIAKGLIRPAGSRVALVLLYDSSLKMIVSDKPSIAVVSGRGVRNKYRS